MTNPLPELLPYHRMARVSVRHRWWRPVLGTGFVAVACVVVAGLLYGIGSVLGSAKGYPEGPDGTVEFGPVTGTALDLPAIASALPVVLLAVLWIGRRGQLPPLPRPVTPPGPGPRADGTLTARSPLPVVREPPRDCP